MDMIMQRAAKNLVLSASSSGKSSATKKDLGTNSLPNGPPIVPPQSFQPLRLSQQDPVSYTTTATTHCGISAETSQKVPEAPPRSQKSQASEVSESTIIVVNKADIDNTVQISTCNPP